MFSFFALNISFTLTVNYLHPVDEKLQPRGARQLAQQEGDSGMPEFSIPTAPTPLQGSCYRGNAGFQLAWLQTAALALTSGTLLSKACGFWPNACPTCALFLDKELDHCFLGFNVPVAHLGLNEIRGDWQNARTTHCVI